MAQCVREIKKKIRLIQGEKKNLKGKAKREGKIISKKIKDIRGEKN